MKTIEHLAVTRRRQRKEVAKRHSARETLVLMVEEHYDLLEEETLLELEALRANARRARADSGLDTATKDRAEGDTNTTETYPGISAIDATEDELIDDEAPSMSFTPRESSFQEPDHFDDHELIDADLVDADLIDDEIGNGIAAAAADTGTGPESVARRWLALRTKLKALEIASLPQKADDLDTERTLRQDLINALEALAA